MDDRQKRVDAIDEEMLRRRLPEHGLAQLCAWWAINSDKYPLGAGAHAIDYTPAKWSQIVPWPNALAERSDTGDAWVSRGQVVNLVRDAFGRSAWAEALVSTYVWGKGKSGSPKGSGPHELEQILGPGTVNVPLDAAVIMLRKSGAVAAYEALRGKNSIKGLGPAFFTKFLYFADRALGDVPGPRALILDNKLAHVLRAQATIVGREMELDPDGALAEWVWSKGWTQHRYEVYLTWMHTVAEQVAGACTGWPTTDPDLLELALFQDAWNPELG